MRKSLLIETKIFGYRSRLERKRTTDRIVRSDEFPYVENRELPKAL